MIGALPILTLEQGKSAIQLKTALSPANEAKLQAMIDALPGVIEDEIGPVGLREVVITGSGSSRGLSLPFRVNSVSAVTLSGVPVIGFTFDSEAAFVGLGSVVPGPVVITAMVGSAVIPPHVIFAAMELLRHWWQVGVQGPGMDGGGGGEFVIPQGYLIPNRVAQLLKPEAANALPGFA